MQVFSSWNNTLKRKVGDLVASEKNFENRVKKFLKDEGCYFIKYWGGGEYTKAGIPDILCCCKGKFFGIEVKAPNGKPIPLQVHNLRRIHQAGGCGILLYPKDFGLFKDLIQNPDNRKLYEVMKGRWVEWEQRFK